jgi:hypothetical protein
VHSYFTSPHETDIDGHKWAYVGVEAGSGYGFVGLQKGRSAQQTLECIKDFESELRQVSGEQDRRVAHHHHHDDKSFRGVVEQHARDSGWLDTHTGGYRPQANSVVERRIGMLHQLFSCLLLIATGGHQYYEQLWGSGLRHANWILNRRPWPDRESDSLVRSRIFVSKTI